MHSFASPLGLVVLSSSGICRLVVSLVVALPAVSVPAMAAPGGAAEHRARLELAEVEHQPDEVLNVIRQLKGQAQSSTTPQLDEVTIVGQVGGMPNPWSETHPDFPWFAGQGSFFLLDSGVAAQFARHAAHHGGDHQCAFCKNLAEKNAHAVAVVNLVDADGQIVPIDTRELLSLREGQSVVVQGRAELLGGTMLVIHADGIRVQP